MYKVAKALHLLGLAMFLGSILGHVSIGFVPGAKDQVQAMLFGRQAIEIATWSLTVPGLALLAATGLFMTFRGGLGFGRRRWLTVHQIIGTSRGSSRSHSQSEDLVKFLSGCDRLRGRGASPRQFLPGNRFVFAMLPR
jgi:hypothetical protein